MDKTLSYVNYISDQIILVILQDKTFLFFRNSNFNEKKEKNKRLKSVHLSMEDFF